MIPDLSWQEPTLEMMHFVPFETAHLIALALIVVVALGLPLLVRSLAPQASRLIARGLAALILLQELVQLLLLVQARGWSAELLPLQLCSLALYLTAWTLLSPGARTFETAYFWGLGGTTQALLTPDLAQGFPDPAFLLFFLGHGLVIVGIAYAGILFRLRPQLGSLVRVPAITLAAAAVAQIANLALGTNFMYLMAKPNGPSLLDWLGPWPWYWLGLVAVALVSFGLLYLPFLIHDRFAGCASGPRR
jgi:hypothetical integral membrane protein (TIGR02206 family)